MKICMVISTPFPPEEGIGYHVYNLSKNLIKRGHEVTVITRGFLKVEKSFLDGIKIIKTPFIPLYPIHVNIHGLFVNNLLKSIEHKFDIINIHTPLSPIIKTNLPTISTIHTSVIENARHTEIVDLKSLSAKIMTKLVSSSLISKLIKNSNLVATVANSVARELKKYYGFDKANVVGNGVDEKLFKPIKKKGKEKYILYVGRLSYRKGLFDFLKVAKQICKNYHIKFILVGKGELEGKLKERVRKENLQDKIIFLGHISRKKLIQLYQNATLLIMPSHYESGPLVILEAMSCGVPIVSTRVGIAPEVISNMKNGILVPVKSPKKIAEAIIKLLKNKGLRRKLGDNARKSILKKHTWKIVTDKYENLYNLSKY